MQITDTLIAALVGAITAVLTGIFTSFISYRVLKAEYSGKQRLEIIGKQIAACESLWAILDSGSLSLGENRVVYRLGDRFHLNPKSAAHFHDSINKIFLSSSGLYFSRQLRDAIFELRDFIEKDFLITQKEITSNIEISTTKVKYFDGLVANLRNCIRKEIGVEDLKAGSENPIK